MHTPKTLQSIAACALSISASASFTHENHGMTGTRWHATGAWGFVALAGAAGVALWFKRGGK